MLIILVCQILRKFRKKPYRFVHLTWEIQTSYFSTLLFIYFRLFTLPQKKTNSNCHTAALAVYYYCLVLPAICIALVLRLGHSTEGARVLIWTC